MVQVILHTGSSDSRKYHLIELQGEIESIYSSWAGLEIAKLEFTDKVLLHFPILHVACLAAWADLGHTDSDYWQPQTGRMPRQTLQSHRFGVPSSGGNHRSPHLRDTNH